MAEGKTIFLHWRQIINAHAMLGSGNECLEKRCYVYFAVLCTGSAGAVIHALNSKFIVLLKSMDDKGFKVSRAAGLK